MERKPSAAAGQAAAPPPVQVAVETGPHAGMFVVWQQPGAYLIGRGPHAQLPLVHDVLASVEHCRLEIGPTGCTIRDLGSRQGTVLNGSPITASVVRTGDGLLVGMSRLRFTVGSELAPTIAAPADPLGVPTAANNLRASAELPQGVLNIPGYAISRKLGQGGMGVVYEAVSRSTGERVAIKTIIPAPGASLRGVPLFRREMKLLSELNHPRIVRFLESGEHAGQIFLVMEYVDCISPATAVKPYPYEHRIALYCGIVCQVLEALEFAHGRKLVHRDVKPGNILITQHEGQLHARLADFGLAKNFELAGLSQLTADDEIRGTLAFMPWEQLEGSRYARPTVDIYSAGATLYYYLKGRAPGRAPPRRKLWNSVTSLFVRSPSRTPATTTEVVELTDLPAGLAEVLSQSLASAPRDRFATATAMRAALLPHARPQW